MERITWDHIENFPHYFRFGSKEDWDYFVSTIPDGCAVRTKTPEHYPCLAMFFGDKPEIEIVEWFYASDFNHEDGHKRAWETDEDAMDLSLVKSEEELEKLLLYYESFSTRWLLDKNQFPYYALVLLNPKPNEDAGEVEIEFIPIYRDALFDA